MSLQVRLEALAAAIGADIKALIDPAQAGWGWFIPCDGSNAITVLGSATPSSTGTLTAAVRAITSKFTRTRRIEYLVTTAATTAVAGWRIPANHLVRGNAAGIGGFYSKQVWGPATGVATATNRAFVGLSASTSAPTNVEPSTALVSCIGMGWGSADTNVQLMHSDSSAGSTLVDLGASFLVPTVDRSSMYQIEIWCAPNATSLDWKVTNLISGAVVSGNTGASTDIPANTAYLSERGWMSVGGTSSVIGIALFGGRFQAPSW